MSQGHYPWCYLKGFNKLSMHDKYEGSIFRGSKVTTKVKVFLPQSDIQIDRRTDRQDKN